MAHLIAPDTSGGRSKGGARIRKKKSETLGSLDVVSNFFFPFPGRKFKICFLKKVKLWVSGPWNTTAQIGGRRVLKIRLKVEI